MTNRPTTPLLSQFLGPVVRSIATRAKVFGVLLAILSVVVGFGAVMVVRPLLDSHDVKNEHGAIALIMIAMTVALGVSSYLRIRLGVRASRLAERTWEPAAHFMMDTRRMGEVGPDGGILSETSIPITAEQFAQLLATPRPIVPGMRVGGTPEVPRAIIHRRSDRR